MECKRTVARNGKRIIHTWRTYTRPRGKAYTQEGWRNRLQRGPKINATGQRYGESYERHGSSSHLCASRVVGQQTLSTTSYQYHRAVRSTTATTSSRCARRVTTESQPRRGLVRRRNVDVGRLLGRPDLHHLRDAEGVGHAKNDRQTEVHPSVNHARNATT
jgi:hypothetical protein